MILCLILSLTVVGCTSSGARVQQVPTAASQEATPAAQEATAVPTAVTYCGDPLSNPLSASSGGQPGSTAVSRTYTPTINITRNDYEAALAKWRVQQIYEYEVNVEHVAMMGFRGRIHVTGDHVEVLPTIINGEPRIPAGKARAGDYTVEALFDQVDIILTQGLCPATGEWAFPVAYDVAFHPDMGYPTHIERRGYTPPEWGQDGRFSTAPAHSSYWITVSNLQVIRTGVPGMPGSGHPEQ
ncbi:MAG: DUF6174 domain-containing protein [Chloroflexota bacterium]|nr:DUF6174 domain-containing protein [Chloroflexota bacterium]